MIANGLDYFTGSNRVLPIARSYHDLFFLLNLQDTNPLGALVVPSTTPVGLDYPGLFEHYLRNANAS